MTATAQTVLQDRCRRQTQAEQGSLRSTKTVVITGRKSMLDKALLVDASGQPIAQHHKVFSSAWDEIKAWSSKVYMPYDVSPIGKQIAPAATMHSAQVGATTATRFKYGIPVHIKDWDQDAGNAFIATTIGGTARHWVDRSNAVETAVGHSFVVDCSRTDYWVDFDPDHLQFNLTIPHALLEKTALEWFGFVPNDSLWGAKVGLGGPESSWLSLMEFVARSVAEAPGALAEGPAARSMEQIICVRLLNEWAKHAGLDLNDPRQSLAPRSVRAAEQYMIENAACMPTMSEVAAAAGTTLRTLSGAFKAFRGYTPSAFLREQRLAGARRSLANAAPGDTVTSVAASWGFINMGEFAARYRHRFGELPSKTLRRN
jgi:AraC-like DNA-binding protein